MTFDEFTRLHEEKKAKLLWAKGANIGERTCGIHTLFLYQIFSFYVEVVYDSSTGDIEALRPFDDTDLLEPYLQDIQVPDLY